MKLFDFWVQIRNATQTSEKKRLIKEAVHHNPIAKEVLRYTYDEDLQFYISTKGIDKISTIEIQSDELKRPTFTIEELWENTIKPLLDALTNRTISGNTALDAVVDVVMQLTPVTERSLFYCILAKDLRAGISRKTINSAAGFEVVPEFVVQLANTYDPKKIYKDITHWFASPKLDGIRTVYKHNKNKLYTRQGKELVGFTTLKHQCKQLCDKYEIQFLDGELFSFTYSFQELQGAVIAKVCTDRQEAIRETTYLNVFASLPAPNTTAMVEKLKMALCKLPVTKVDPWYKLYCVPQKLIPNDPDVIQEETLTYVKSGYEGIMLRHPNICYSWGRDNNLLKFKLFKEADLIITGVFEGQGKYEGKLGGLCCRGVLSDGTQIATEVGSGFTDDQRKKLWINQQGILGQTAEIKYQNVTDKPDDRTGKYSLRFPTFLKLKLDRERK